MRFEFKDFDLHWYDNEMVFNKRRCISYHNLHQAFTHKADLRIKFCWWTTTLFSFLGTCRCGCGNAMLGNHGTNVRLSETFNSVHLYDPEPQQSLHPEVRIMCTTLTRVVIITNLCSVLEQNKCGHCSHLVSLSPTKYMIRLTNTARRY